MKSYYNVLISITSITLPFLKYMQVIAYKMYLILSVVSALHCLHMCTRIETETGPNSLSRCISTESVFEDDAVSYTTYTDVFTFFLKYICYTWTLSFRLETLVTSFKRPKIRALFGTAVFYIQIQFFWCVSKKKIHLLALEILLLWLMISKKASWT